MRVALQVASTEDAVGHPAGRPRSEHGTKPIDRRLVMGQARWGRTGIRVGLSLAIAAGLAAFVRPAIGVVVPVWAEPVTVSDTAVPVEAPAVAGSARGMLAVWRAFDGTNWRIRASRRPFGGPWSAPRYLSPAGHDAEAPVAASTGYYYLPQQAAWLLFNGANWVVQTSVWSQPSKSAPGGWSAPVTVSVPGQDAAAPHVEIVVEDTGHGLQAAPKVFWRRFDGAHWRVQGAAGDADASFGTPQTLSVAGQDAEYLGVQDQLVTWSRFDGEHWRAQWRGAYAAGQGFSLTDTFTMSPAGEDALDPQMRGQTAAVWMTDSGGHRQLRATTSTDSGRTWLPPVTLSATGADVASPAMGSPGTAVWSELADGEWRVRAADWDAVDGWQPPVFLSEPGQDAQDPTIADNRGLAAWVRFDGAHWRVEAARWQPAGTWTRDGELSGADRDATDPVVGTDAVLWVQTGAGTPRIQARGLDTEPPETTVRPLGGFLYKPGKVPVSWSAKDDWSPIASYDLRYRVRTWDSSTWNTVRVLTASQQTSTDLLLGPGRVYCFAARARDTLSRLGSWWAATCALTPVDDRTLTRHGGWWLKKDTGYYAGTYLQATRRGSKLTLPIHQHPHVRLLVSRGPGQGKIHVQYGSPSWDFNLWATSFKRQVVLPALSNYSQAINKTLTITVTSSGKQVRVDGVFVGG